MKKVLIGALILIAVVILGALGFYLVDKNSEQAAKEQKLFLLEATMYKSTDKYAECYNSINYGTTMIGNVRLDIIGQNFGNDSITIERLDKIEESFMDGVKAECNATVADYENKYVEYKRLSDETSETANWLSFLVGGSQNQTIGNKLTEFEPSMVRVLSGNSLENFIFTKEDVEKYFREQLGL